VKTIVVAKADKVYADVDSVFIKIEDSIPCLSGPEELSAYYKAQAYSIATALVDSLPGGVFDHLLIELLERQASLLKRAYAR
jgi:hypothetical protein